ncbi:TOM (translocase of outer membrane) complex component [Coemansia javaensis]|uniref:TOM (Translocase of outer membrane) complex component n=1 Tax=Coemansia javaensis TaxID=2761396 RepID=A0A9W8LHP5_9FUNG|nr:TOM (translocase of outer membrane) complex component [Coemansia javaensis]
MAERAGQKTASSSVLDRLSGRSWGFYAAAAIPPVVVAGLALWYYSSSSSSSSSAARAASRSGDKKDDKKKRQRRAKKAKRGAKAAGEGEGDGEGEGSPARASGASLDGGDEEAPEQMTDEQIAGLDRATAKKLAQSLKSRGNRFFQAKRYGAAIELYTHALRFEKDPVFYSNRAACFAAEGDHGRVIEDCTAAVELEPQYVKALMRRAQAYEHTDRFRDALYDFTTVCILEDFGNSVAAGAAERVLKRLAEAEARERVAKREPRLPSRSFISGYLKSFRSAGPAAAAAAGEQLSEADALYNEALELTAQQEYARAIEAIDRAVAAVEQAGAAGVQRADDLYSLRGMFSFLKSNLPQAQADLDRALEINPGHVRSYLRKANVFTEKKDLDEVSRLLDRALEADANNAETYFQRGQARFLKQEYAQAATDYARAAELDEDFVYPRIQLGVVQFKTGKLEEAMATFDEAMKRFPQRSDLYNYYGEVLAEQGGSDNAISAFEKAVELDASNPLPYVNQAIALFQSRSDVDKALTLIQEAFKVDAECELAVAALSQIYLQMGMFDESLDMLRRAVELAKSEEEMVSAITFRETTAAQHRFMKEHPELLNKIMMGAM